MSTLALYREILKQRQIEYVLTDVDRRVMEYSPGILAYARRISGPLLGQPLERAFDLLTGMETDLEEVAAQRLPSLSLEKIEHLLPDGRKIYFSLQVFAYGEGLLALFSDVSAEANLEQRITQQRNELNLLSAQLARSRAELDDLLHRFIPSRVADKVISQPGQVQLGGNRHNISVLFADMRGFTPLSEILDPEALLELLNQHFGLLGKVITQTGGEITNYAGDMVMAVFNGHNDQPDHAARAVLAGLEIQRALNQLAAQPLKGMPFVFDFGVGINTGEAVLGYLGCDNRLEYTAIGEMVNIASRLSGHAAGGQVLLTRAVYEKTADNFSARDLGQVSLRGHLEPVWTYQALADSTL